MSVRLLLLVCAILCTAVCILAEDPMVCHHSLRHLLIIAQAKVRGMHIAALKACKRGDDKECVDRFAAIREQYPDIVEFYSDPAPALARLGRIDEAIELLERGLEVRPGHAPSIKVMYEILQQAANVALSNDMSVSPHGHGL